MAGNSPYDLYPTTASKKELDLRLEMNRTLYGAADEQAKGAYGLLRRMRKNSKGDLIRCECRNSITDEPAKDYYCRYCLGMGYYWDEIPIIYFRNDDSFKQEKYKEGYFYLEYNTEVTTDDYIVTVDRDEDGNVAVPITRDKTFRVIAARPLRADNGRIEYWVIRAIEERKWSTWYGVKLRTGE